MNRFFVRKENILEDEKKLFINNRDDIKHISKVLRLNKGDILEICNGEKREYLAEIREINKDEIECKILNSMVSKSEPEISITLFQSIPKGSKMELIIQKCVEIGVKDIIPVISKRCVAKIKDVKSEDKKLERWNKISLEAAKQSKRGIIPKVGRVIKYSDIEKIASNYDLIIIPYELENSVGIKKVLKKSGKFKNIAVIIGSEGGFEEEEILEAVNWGAKPVTLGPRILRTETAGLVALSVILYELGDLGGN
ncbi:16S rRNA (uracil1498-N3)-methyltransferase [Caminicella sporogenes DSM 14501]|uniref:Ribosomal RNA small subunit methyltransferase E n=1 Tax=Caminicella sporogenes DSM 14501 TaxID=1121266 RepID=A0A1M6MC70_9FIRM|nr:16S rRNA (uracil(1498)-N(3))-methyltransferase [Caminicella sporogenes]RKD27608.1 16S rRNA methyltransferase [Caminicella sporogenes]WIF94805.1 16S rRNA (uracil(1498)-N(3))-methyltransferase [Caminicella sporogenes]SHJ81071.1 16S rRNA (uracil1498-N3)-methyltransferase [Caminicella sporogenes DSM 14501]